MQLVAEVLGDGQRRQSRNKNASADSSEASTPLGKGSCRNFASTESQMGKAEG